MTGNNILEEFKNAWDRPNNAIVQIILINVAVFLTLMVLRIVLVIGGDEALYDRIVSLFMLPSEFSAFLFKPWTIITYFFTHEGFMHIIFNMLFLYWFGKLIAEFLGSNKVISLYVLGGLAGGIFYMLMYNFVPFYQDRGFSQMLGASAGVYAIVVGAATFMPNYTFFLLLIGPVRIKYIAIFYVVLSFSQSIGSNAGGELAHLAGAGIGFLYITQLRKGNDLGIWVIQIMNFFKSFFIRQPKIKVTHRSTTKRAKRKSKPKTEAHSTSDDQDEIDSILDKISHSGYESLTKDEKQKLFNASKK